MSHRRRRRHRHPSRLPSASVKSHLFPSSHLFHLTPTEYGRPPAELHPDAATDSRPPPARRHILVPAIVRPGRSIRQGSRERCSHGWGYSRCPILASLFSYSAEQTSLLLFSRTNNTDTWCRTIKLNLQSILPDYPTLDLFDFPSLQLYPPPPAIHSDSGTEQLGTSRPPFPTSQTFSIPFPERIPLPSWAHQDGSDGGGGDGALLPGTLNLTAYNKGQIRYSLTVGLVLSSGQTISHSIPIEGTPPVHHEPIRGDEKDEVEQVLTKKGVMTRLVLSTARPRLGDLLHLGVEIKREASENSSSSKGEKGMAEGEEEETKAALRRMRRVTVELFRRVIVHLPEPNPRTITHQTVLHASGKSLRYPGPSPTNPPLRLLFTIPTIPNPSSSTTTTHGGTGEQSWGEVSTVGGYHQVTFGVKVGVGGGIGVGVGVGVGVGGWDENDFVVEKEIEILPKIWSSLPPDQHHHHQQQQQQQQRATYQLQTQDGFAFDIPPELAAELSLNSSPSPYSSNADADAEAETDTLSARDAYRLKGRDIVGPSGTTRLPSPSSSRNARDGGGGDGEDDLPPPPFESSAESSAIDATPTSLDGPGPGPSGGYFEQDVDVGQGSGLPSFLESEQQEERRARARAASLSDACLYALRGARGKEREASAGRSTAGSARTRGGAAPVEGNGQGAEEEEGWSDDEELGVGREGLGGELATWIEVCHILPPLVLTRNRKKTHPYPLTLEFIVRRLRNILPTTPFARCISPRQREYGSPSRRRGTLGFSLWGCR